MGRQGFGGGAVRHMTTVFLCIAAALVGCSPPEQEVVADAWVRLSAVPGRPAAGYFTLRGYAVSSKELVSVDSRLAKRIELHTTEMRDGMMSMRPLGPVVTGDNDRSFAPGGDHAMIYGLSPSVQVGTTLPLRFRFKDGSSVTLQAQVRAAGDAGHDMNH